MPMPCMPWGFQPWDPTYPMWQLPFSPFHSTASTVGDSAASNESLHSTASASASASASALAEEQLDDEELLNQPGTRSECKNVGDT